MNILDFFNLSQKSTPLVCVLIELRRPGGMSWYFTNSSHNITWEGQTYRATAMNWKFPETKNGVPQGGVFEITVNEVTWETSGLGTELLRWFDMADHQAKIVIRAIVNNQGEISPLENMVQRHGNATWNGKQITWNPDPDDRLNMHANPWTLDQHALLV